MKFLTLLCFLSVYLFFGNQDSYAQQSPWLKKNSTIKKIEQPAAKKEVLVVKRDKYTKAEHEAKILEARISAERGRIENSSQKEQIGESLTEEEKAIARKNLKIAEQKLTQLKAKAGVSQN